MLFEDQAVYPVAELFLIRQFMKARQVKPAQWLLGTGLREEETYRQDTLVSLRQFDMIYRNIYRLCRQPGIGLELGRALNLSRWGVVGMAQMCSKTLGDALETGNQYQGLLRGRFHLNPVMTASRCEIGIIKREGMDYPVNAEFAHELVLGTITSQMQDISGREIYFDEVLLAYPDPGYAALYEKYLGCRVRFNCKRTMAAVTKKNMTRPLPMQNRVAKLQALTLYDEQLTRVAALQKADFRWQVRAVLARQDEGVPRLDTVADALQITPRTLRRKLQQVNSSYRDVCREFQVQKALDYLAFPGMKISVIAGRCGFSDLASFREAFKRQMGITPQAYRKNISHGERT